MPENQPLFPVFTAVVSDPELSPPVYDLNILRPHWEIRAGWIRVGLSGTDVCLYLCVIVIFLHPTLALLSLRNGLIPKAGSLPPLNCRPHSKSHLIFTS